MTGYARLAEAVEVPTETGVLPEVFPRKIAGAEGVLMLSLFVWAFECLNFFKAMSQFMSYFYRQKGMS